MSTQKQIKANRQNAQKSTGPKTDEGKAAVSKNAVKHGLFAAEAVITGEDPADYEAFHDNFLAELAPVGMVESTLAERVISMAWRLQRAERMQTQVIEDMIERKVTNPSAIRSREWDRSSEGIRPGDPRYDPEHLALGRIATSDWSYFRVLDRMLMYERRIENSMMKMIKDLKRFQIMRRIELQDANQQNEPSPSLRDGAATRSALAVSKGNLKKQSQNYGSQFQVPGSAVTARKGNVKKQSQNYGSQFQVPGSAVTARKGNVKKQTQFIEDLMGAKSLMQRIYNNNPAGLNEENKANSNPISGQLRDGSQESGACPGRSDDFRKEADSSLVARRS
jgi:hypothetical protein